MLTSVVSPAGRLLNTWPASLDQVILIQAVHVYNMCTAVLESIVLLDCRFQKSQTTQWSTELIVTLKEYHCFLLDMDCMLIDNDTLSVL